MKVHLVAFLTDVERVLRVLRQQQESALIGEELRCLLFSATVLSLTNNLNPEAVIEFLLAQGCWTLDQALSFAYQYTDDKKRQFIQSVAKRPLVREHALEVLRFVGRVEDETARVESLEHLMRHVAGDERLLRQAVICTLDLTNDDAKLRAIKCVVPIVLTRDELAKQTIGVAQTIVRPRTRERALQLFVSYSNQNTPLFKELLQPGARD